MIYSICNSVLLISIIFVEWYVVSKIKKFLQRTDALENLIVKNASFTAELSDRVDGLEDYVKMIRSETENDKHKDYWQSVMDYNPFIEKEGEK